MKSSFLLKNLIALALMITSSLSADTQIAIMYSAANPDYKPYESSYGTSISGEMGFDNGLFLMGYYSNTDFKPGGPDAGGVSIDSWTEIGLGYAFHNEWGDFYSLLTLENIKANTKTFEGHGAHFGYRTEFAQNWQATLQLGYIDTEFNDWQLSGRVQYNISNNIGLTLRLRDYHRWDHTVYEAGIVFQF